MQFIREFNSLAVWIQLVILIMILIVSVGLLKKLSETFKLSVPAGYGIYLKLLRHLMIAVLLNFLLINWWLELPLLSMPAEWSPTGRGAFIVFNMAVTSFFYKHMP